MAVLMIGVAIVASATLAMMNVVIFNTMKSYDTKTELKKPVLDNEY